MEYNKNKTNAFDATVKSLCNKIDELQAEVDYWRERYEDERKSHDKLLSDNLAESKKGVANALMFALSMREDLEGNIVIDSSDREQLAERFFKTN